jgi:hypothetical protein
MSHDPFRAPSSNVDVPDTARGSAVKAVVLGLMTDVGGSMLSSLAFFMFYGAYLGATGGTADDLMVFARGNGFDSPMALALGLVGCMFSVLGGYVCARIAKHSEYKLGLILSACSVAVGSPPRLAATANAIRRHDGLFSPAARWPPVMTGARTWARGRTPARGAWQ